MADLPKMERGINQSSTLIPTSSQKVGTNAQRRREQLVQDVLKRDESVKFYTGTPSLSCFMLLVNTPPPPVCRKNEELGQEQSSEILLPEWP